MIHKIFISLIIISVLTLFAGQQAFCESEREEKTFGNYRVRTHFNHKTRWGKLEILKKGRRIYVQKSEGRCEIGLKEDIESRDIVNRNKVHPKDSYEPIEIGRDITGRGIPNLVISEWTGGAHCCFNFYVFEIGKKFRKIAKLEAEHGLARFADLDSDSSFEFITNDWTFAYWNTSFGDSPAPDIILRFDKGKYVIAEKFMRKPAPSAEELEAKVLEIKAESSSKLLRCLSYPPTLLWKTMLDLIYTGNMDLAWKFFDKAWDKSFKGKKKFLREFRGQLRTSPYWSQIKKMNAR